MRKEEVDPLYGLLERMYARQIARNSQKRWGGYLRYYMPNALKLARDELRKEARRKEKIEAKRAELARLEKA